MSIFYLAVHVDFGIAFGKCESLDGKVGSHYFEDFFVFFFVAKIIDENIRNLIVWIGPKFNF